MDRLLGISIENFRSIEALDFDLAPMRVLMGENGGGKSSILECFEILRMAAEPRFFDQLDRVHGGTIAMQRHGATTVHLRARIQLGDLKDHAIYSLSFGGQPGYSTTPKVESLTGSDPNSPIFRVQAGQFEGHQRSETVLSTGVIQNGVAHRVRQVLANIEVQLAVEVAALWRQRERTQNSVGFGMREPSQLRSGGRLERGGGNLPSVIHSLRNDQGRAEWDLTLEIIKLALGEGLEDVTVSVMDSGYASLVLRYRDGRKIPAQGLSDGQLAFLCFVAMARSSSPKSALLIDEPELHLHPGLLVRVFDLLQDASNRFPIVLATHSSALLDAIEKPEDDIGVVSVRGGATRIDRLDSAFLHRWNLPLSQLRSEHGDQALVISPS